MAGKLTLDARVISMLELLAAHGGRADASDYPDDLLRAFYDDRGAAPDTFNLAIAAGLIRVSHDFDNSTSTASIEPAGRAALSQEDGR